ncbi:hypothetical protein [Streptomyces sp. NPDC048425]|uniref:hypothetical protein n=1 Tax=Streptomyces sp. NPDC048425 TaxID=3365548 RepID=UPI00371223D2
MARTLPDRCPSKHLGFTGIGLWHQRAVLPWSINYGRGYGGVAIVVVGVVGGYVGY